MAQRPAYPGQRTIIASLRIPEPLVIEIDAAAKARGISRTALLREVLRLGWAAYRHGARSGKQLLTVGAVDRRAAMGRGRGVRA